jgi:hypothetical protein
MLVERSAMLSAGEKSKGEIDEEIFPNHALSGAAFTACSFRRHHRRA